MILEKSLETFINAQKAQNKKFNKILKDINKHTFSQLNELFKEFHEGFKKFESTYERFSIIMLELRWPPSGRV